MTRALSALAICMTAAVVSAEENAASIAVGPEIAVATDGPGKDCRGNPAVAFGKESYLCAWREGWEGKNGGARIRVAWVTDRGTLVDTKPYEIAPNKDKDAPQERPRVACCGWTFLVVWQDLRNGTDYDVLAARISVKTGEVLDAQPIKIAVGPHNQTLPDIASDADGFLVVWQSFEEKDRAFHGYSARVGLDGKVGETAEVGVAPCLKIAWDGTSFLVACAGSGFWGVGDVRRLSRDGQPLAKEKPFRATIRVGQYALSAVPGKGWLLVTHRSPPDAWGWGGPGAMRCYFVLSEGKMDGTMPKETDYPGYGKLDPNCVDCATKDRSNWPYGGSASAWDGRHSVVVWQRYHCVGEKKSMLANSDLMAMQTDGWKRLSDAAVPVAASEAEELEPALASDGAGNLLCVYEKEAGRKTVICARALTAK